MGVAKPKEGAGLYAKKVLDKIFRERTGKETKVVKRELLSEVAMGLIPGPGAGAVPRIARQRAVRDVTRGYLNLLRYPFSRKQALQAAKPQVGAIGRLPQELLDLVEKIEVRQLPGGTRAKYTEFVLRREAETARRVGRPLSEAPVKRREIYIDPYKAKPTSVYHEAGHLVQRTTKDPALKKLLKPVAKEYAEETAPHFESLAEKHARDFGAELVSRSMWEGPGRRFSVKELDRFARESLEETLKKSGWVP